jgi:hypothetical protein
MPATWTTYAIRTQGSSIFIGLPLTSPQAHGQMFDIIPINVVTPAEYESESQACATDEAMCVIPTELGRNSTHVFTSGQFFIAGGYDPCDDQLEALEPYFCSVHMDMMPINDNTYNFDSSFKVTK